MYLLGRAGDGDGDPRTAIGRGAPADGYDPGRATGTADEQLVVYHRVRDEIRARIETDLLADGANFTGAVRPTP